MESALNRAQVLDREHRGVANNNVSVVIDIDAHNDVEADVEAKRDEIRHEINFVSGPMK